MSTILFNEIVFGPVKSRRLGVSLGVNLLPRFGKWCNFDCIYCDYILVADKRGAGMTLPCPGCGRLITVPRPKSAPPAQADG